MWQRLLIRARSDGRAHCCLEREAKKLEQMRVAAEREQVLMQTASVKERASMNSTPEEAQAAARALERAKELADLGMSGEVFGSGKALSEQLSENEKPQETEKEKQKRSCLDVTVKECVVPYSYLPSQQQP